MAQQKMADRLGLHVRTVKRSLERLRKFGYIRTETNGRKGPARRNRYYIIHEYVDSYDDRMWSPTGERQTLDGPRTENPVGGTLDPQPLPNGGVAAPIMGAPGAPQEREVRERNDLRKNPYGSETPFRTSEFKKPPKNLLKTAKRIEESAAEEVTVTEEVP